MASIRNLLQNCNKFRSRQGSYPKFTVNPTRHSKTYRAGHSTTIVVLSAHEHDATTSPQPSHAYISFRHQTAADTCPCKEPT